MAIALVQQSAAIVSTGSWSTGTTKAITLPANMTAGNLLLIWVMSTTSGMTFSGPAGSALTVESGASGVSDTHLFHYENNPGGSSSFNVTNTSGVNGLSGLLFAAEFSGVATSSSKDTTGSNAGTTSPLTATTAGNVATAASLGIGGFSDNTSMATSTTWGAGSGWTKLADNGASGTSFHMMCTYQLNVSSGSTLAEAATDSASLSRITGVVAVFKPATAAPGIVFDSKIIRRMMIRR